MSECRCRKGARCARCMEEARFQDNVTGEWYRVAPDQSGWEGSFVEIGGRMVKLIRDRDPGDECDSEECRAGS